ncbi:MAG: hydrogenase maturation nickel metallochaperone HypA [Chloroflexi bacterium]|nr:hydrogenase maturation nickel metallochaperone HypA [Chloroflexota bacterium]
MHELGICQELVEAALRRSAGRPVTGVRIRVGSLHRVDGPSMAQAFELLTEGTELEGADLDLVVVPAQATCGSCGRTTPSDGPQQACPGCGALDPRLSGGDDLLLESIRLAPAMAAGSAV